MAMSDPRGSISCRPWLRAFRSARWEVIRIRTGHLEPLGPYDLQLTTLGKRAVARVIDRLPDVLGPLLVNAYLM